MLILHYEMKERLFLFYCVLFLLSVEPCESVSALAQLEVSFPPSPLSLWNIVAIIDSKCHFPELKYAKILAKVFQIVSCHFMKLNWNVELVSYWNVVDRYKTLIFFFRLFATCCPELTLICFYTGTLTLAFVVFFKRTL